VRLAIVVSHPIQYYAPWFSYLTSNTSIHIKVFYLWDYGISETYDRDFQQNISWKIQLLEGYDYELLKNTSKSPGTHHFFGLENPDLIEILADFSPQAILLFGYYSYTHLRLLTSARLKKIPKILRGDSHCLLSGYRSWLRSFFIRKILSKYDAALYVGKANKEYLIKHGFKEQNIFFSPHAVNQAHFFPDENSRLETRKKLGIKNEEIALFFVGKFEQKKCPVLLAKLFLDITNPNLRLFYVGSGPLQRELERISEAHRRIKIVGFVDQTEMPSIYRAADYVILPSFGPKETWGFCIQEAMCCGAAVICSTHVGCAYDLITQGENGFIFPAGDWSSLKRILEGLPSEQSYSRTMGKRGSEKMKFFNYSVATKGLLSSLEYLIHEK